MSEITTTTQLPPGINTVQSVGTSHEDREREYWSIENEKFCGNSRLEKPVPKICAVLTETSKTNIDSRAISLGIKRMNH